MQKSLLLSVVLFIFNANAATPVTMTVQANPAPFPLNCSGLYTLEFFPHDIQIQAPNGQFVNPNNNNRTFLVNAQSGPLIASASLDSCSTQCKWGDTVCISFCEISVKGNGEITPGGVLTVYCATQQNGKK